MFGYVNINKGELKVREFELYQSYYCGLCKKLKEKYGFLGQMTLSYDMTFLVILLSALYESEEQRTKVRCKVHPTRKRAITKTDFTEYGADMTILLTYYHFLDDWRDERRLLGAAGARLLEKHHQDLKQQYPRQCRMVKKAVYGLRKAEKENCQELDRVAGYTGQILRAIFVVEPDVWTKYLAAMGMALGKFIYLMDAYEDLEKDLKKGCYNPLAQLSKEDDYEQTCEEMLELLMAEVAAAFEKLPILQNVELLRNIIYAGVWVKHDFIRMKKAEEKEKHGSL